MSQNQQKQQLTEITSINAERVSPTPEEVEFFIEQIESQKLYVQYLEQKLQDIEEELRHTNQDLDAMNSELSLIFGSQPMPLNEAKELAKTILASQKPTRDSLAELLSAIYGSIVDPWELGLRQMPPPININPKIRAELDQFSAGRKQLKTETLQMRALLAAFKTQLNSMMVEYRETNDKRAISD